jgi:hypothetical protein
MFQFLVAATCFINLVIKESNNNVRELLSTAIPIRACHAFIFENFFAFEHGRLSLLQRNSGTLRSGRGGRRGG